MQPATGPGIAVRPSLTKTFTVVSQPLLAIYHRLSGLKVIPLYGHAYKLSVTIQWLQVATEVYFP